MLITKNDTIYRNRGYISYFFKFKNSNIYNKKQKKLWKRITVDSIIIIQRKNVTFI